MITGMISEKLDPVLNDVFARRADGALISVRTILDTGFNGAFCMPKKILAQMATKPISVELYELADGSLVAEQNYAGEIIVDNQPFARRVKRHRFRHGADGHGHAAGKRGHF